MANQTHESYSHAEADVPGSDRSFGLVMAAAFALLTLINAWHVGRAWPWTAAVAALFSVFACLRPAVLKPRCFMGSELDFLVAGNCILRKTVQDLNLKRDYSSTFELD